MKSHSYTTVAVFALLGLFVMGACKSSESVSEEDYTDFTTSNVQPRIPNNTVTSPSLTDINSSLSLMDHIRLLPGVQVVGHQVRIRGTNRLLGNNNPLYVIDGIPLGNSYQDAANSVSMYDVSAIRLIRGSELTRRFGSRGTTGVIEVLTWQSPSKAY